MSTTQVMSRPIQTEFEFSFKTYSSKLYTTFLKDVVLLIRKPTKLVLHVSDFSVIFYDFYKALDLLKKSKNLFVEQTLQRSLYSQPYPYLYKTVRDLTPWPLASNKVLQLGPNGKGAERPAGF
jgi:hypothetical protein